MDSFTIKPEVGRELTSREADVLTDIQVPYPNLATNRVLAERAVHFVNEVRRRWEQDTDEIRENWRWIDWLFRGNSLRQFGSRPDVHVPEILKSHRSLVPRIVEAFFGNGQDWFMAVGYDAEDRLRQASITAFCESQLEYNRFREKLAPGVNCLLRYGVMAYKVTFERRKRKQWYHWIEEQVSPDGEVTETHKREQRDVVAYEGNVIRLVDPHRLIVDPYKWDLDELDYIGDFGFQPLDWVLSQTHLFANLDKLRESHQTEQRDATLAMSTSQASARSGLTRRSQSNADQAQPSYQGGRRHTELTEVWCMFDFNTQEGAVEQDLREAVLTVADQNIALQVRENYHDDKHRVYAIGRSSDNGFTFYDVGIYDPAIRTQMEFDHFRTTVYEAADLVTVPRLAVSGPGADLPSSLYDLPPGAIIKDVGQNMQWQPTPNTLGSVPLIDSIMRRDIEEIIGAPRIWQGTESGPGQDSTATEVRRKIEEGNRRLLGQINAVDSCCVRMLQIMHANNQQFVTKKTKFRVLSAKWAKLLQGNSYELKPSELHHSVDFVIHGVRRIQTYGLRGTNLLTFLQVATPFLQEDPTLVDKPKMLDLIFKAMVGEQQDEQVIRTQTSIDDLEDQQDENTRLRLGIRVPVDDRDDDADHLLKMKKAGMFALIRDESHRIDSRMATLEHASRHMENLRKKLAQQKVLAREQEKMAMMQKPQDQAPEAGGFARPRQTNGPGSAQQVPVAGRGSTIEESRNGQ